MSCWGSYAKGVRDGRGKGFELAKGSFLATLRASYPPKVEDECDLKFGGKSLG